MDGEKRSSPSANVHVAHWLIAVALAVIATCLVTQQGGGSARAYAASAEKARPEIMAFPGQLGPRTYGLFMVDATSGNVWCYEYDKEKGKLRLLAARSFLYDRHLGEYNVEEPTPRDVAQLVERMRTRQAEDKDAPKQDDEP